MGGTHSADVMAHRLLAAALNVDALDSAMLDKDVMTSVAASTRHGAARHRHRACVRQDAHDDARRSTAHRAPRQQISTSATAWRSTPRARRWSCSPFCTFASGNWTRKRTSSVSCGMASLFWWLGAKPLHIWAGLPRARALTAARTPCVRSSAMRRQIRVRRHCPAAPDWLGAGDGKLVCPGCRQSSSHFADAGGVPGALLHGDCPHLGGRGVVPAPVSRPAGARGARGARRVGAADRGRG